ncbi:hypothetical protein GN156_00570 [bacterium LRH843]|nr:hypothetical protein [bacterium LRH843]
MKNNEKARHIMDDFEKELHRKLTKKEEEFVKWMSTLEKKKENKNKRLLK